MGMKLFLALVILSVPLWGLDSFPASGSSHQQRWVWHCCKPCNWASTDSLCLDYLLRWTAWAIQNTACFPEYKQRPQRCAGEKRSEGKTVRHWIGFRLLPPATLGYLVPGKGKSLLAPVTGGRIIGFYGLERREEVLEYLVLSASLIYKVWVTIFHLLQGDVCKLMDRRCSETPHLSSWDMLAICSIDFIGALPRQQWAVNVTNTLSLTCWLLTRCCVVCVSAGSAAILLCVGSLFPLFWVAQKLPVSLLAELSF